MSAGVGNYIQLGETLERKRHFLRAACAAWNIACAPEEARTELLDQFLAGYRQWNPGATAEEIRDVRQDMELLIRQKLKQYPAVIRQIVSCELTVIDGKDHVTVASIQPGH